MTEKAKTEIYWTLLDYGIWKMHLAATAKGLVFAGSQNQPFDELAEWAAKRRPGCPLIRDDARLRAYTSAFIEYFNGARARFDLPLDLTGTPFQAEVWRALLEIPYGRTCSYSDLAERIRKPSAARAVGSAVGANPLLIVVPCHRVIGKNKTLTGYRGGLDMKQSLLQLETEPPAAGSTVRHG